MKTYDIIWLGTGQSIGTLAPQISAAGKSLAIIEGGKFGGTCVNYGCTPTKTLVAGARTAFMVRRAGDFGVKVDDFYVDFEKAMERQKANRAKSSAGMEDWLTNMDGVDVYKAYGEFVDEHTIKAGNDTIRGDAIVINTGAKPRQPDIPGLDEVDWLDNEKLLDLDEKPDHLVIIGGSYIGMEFGQIFRRFGSNVTILERKPHLVFREDKDIADAVNDIMQNEGISVELGMDVQKVAAAKNGVKVTFEQNGDSKTVQGTHLLVGAGRIPNTDGLNLDAAGVETDDRGRIPVNDTVQTNVPHIYALGDVNPYGAFTHTSVNDGEIFWDHYTGDGDRKLSMRNSIYAMYIDPPLGRVGLSENQARQSGRNILMATMPMSSVARAVEKDETDGLIKILVDEETEEFVGAAVLGTGGDEVISVIAAFMMTGQSYKTFRKAVLPHPTVAENLPFLLDQLERLE